MVIHYIENRWLLLMLLLTNFTAKCQLAFVLTQENTYFKRFYFKTNRKALGSSKSRYLGFL